MPEQGVDFVPHENIITFEEIIKLCEYFGKLGISKVKITGGEPLVRKNLPYLIKKIKEVPGINNVTLTTNGILLKEQMNSLAEAGLDAINISLDTLDEKSFEKLTRFPYLNKVMEGMEEALKYKEIPVKINCVPIKAYISNESILEMIELARFNNVHIRYIQMMPIGPSKTLTSISEEEIKTLITDTYGDMLHYEYSLGNGPSRYYSINGFKGKIGFISAVNHQFCDSCNRVRLTNQGVLKSCLQYAGGVNLKDLLRAGVLEEEILELIRKGIYNKPKKHQFESVTTTLDTLSNHSLEHCNMSQIGG
jgi:cyclic pyranopterin phosphate synthase